MNSYQSKCQHCGEGVELTGELDWRGVDCPHCGKTMIPGMATADKREAAEKILLNETEARREKLRSTAGFMAIASGCLVVLALVFFVRGLAGRDGQNLFLVLGASAMGAALWLYLISQIIHIRANTLRD